MVMEGRARIVGGNDALDEHLKVDGSLRRHARLDGAVHA